MADKFVSRRLMDLTQGERLVYGRAKAAQIRNFGFI